MHEQKYSKLLMDRLHSLIHKGHRINDSQTLTRHKKQRELRTAEHLDTYMSGKLVAKKKASRNNLRLGMVSPLPYGFCCKIFSQYFFVNLTGTHKKEQVFAKISQNIVTSSNQQCTQNSSFTCKFNPHQMFLEIFEVTIVSAVHCKCSL